MVNENFNTLKDLYNRVTPALKSKVRELERNQVFFVTEKDIWDCLRKTKWKEETDLTLFDIVNDILFIEEKELYNFINLKKQPNTLEENEKPVYEATKNEELDKEDTIL